MCRRHISYPLIYHTAKAVFHCHAKRGHGGEPLKTENYPFISEKPTAVALGFFDGVHLAHRKILNGAVLSKAEGLLPTVFTFKSLFKKAPTGELTTAKEKSQIFETLGIDALIIADFEHIKDFSPEEFVKEILHEKLNAKKVFCGYNYRFGKGAEGDIFALKEICRKYDIEVFVTQELALNGEEVSSTQIKKLLAEGDVTKANTLLSTIYSFEGEIIHGEKLGRRLGTPTLNIELSERKFLPRFGVYAAEVAIDGNRYRAVLNLGKKPTVKGDEKVTLEAYLLDVTGDFYGNFARAELLEFLRDEQKFSSLEELKKAIHADIAKAKAALKDSLS